MSPPKGTPSCMRGIRGHDCPGCGMMTFSHTHCVQCRASGAPSERVPGVPPPKRAETAAQAYQRGRREAFAEAAKEAKRRAALVCAVGAKSVFDHSQLELCDLSEWLEERAR